MGRGARGGQGIPGARGKREASGGAEVPGSPGFSVRVSDGIAEGVPEQGDSLELYINRADSALYTAKKSGRDQIVEYDPVATFMSDI